MFLLIKKTLAQAILVTDGDINIPLEERLSMLVMTFIKSAPIVFILTNLNFWFKDNQNFFVFLIWILIANMIAGIWKHLKDKTFNWNDFFFKNFQMWAILLITYPILDMIHSMTGENAVSEVFEMVIQIATLLYPGSKIMKNMYLISNGQFPPKFIMEKLYNFQKSGDINELTREDKKELSQEEREDFEKDLKE